MATKASEFGGGPGQFDGVSSVEKLYPHLERQALWEASGGKEVVTGNDGVPVVAPPAYGVGGVKVATELL